MPIPANIGDFDTKLFFALTVVDLGMTAEAVDARTAEVAADVFIGIVFTSVCRIGVASRIAGVAVAVVIAVLEGTNCSAAVVVLVELLLAMLVAVGNGGWMRTVVATVGMVGVVTTFMPDRAPDVPLVAVCNLTGCKSNRTD